MGTKVVDVRSGAGDKSDLPAREKVIHVERTDPDTGHVYGGPFTIKRLTIGDIRQVAIRKAELCGGMPIDSLDRPVQYMNTMLAHLEIAIIKSPEWWKPDDFFTGDIIVDVYDEVMEFEESFRTPIPGQSSATSADSESSAQSGTVPVEEVVDPQVPTAADV